MKRMILALALILPFSGQVQAQTVEWLWTDQVGCVNNSTNDAHVDEMETAFWYDVEGLAGTWATKRLIRPWDAPIWATLTGWEPIIFTEEGMIEDEPEVHHPADCELAAEGNEYCSCPIGHEHAVLLGRFNQITQTYDVIDVDYSDSYHSEVHLRHCLESEALADHCQIVMLWQKRNPLEAKIEEDVLV